MAVFIKAVKRALVKSSDMRNPFILVALLTIRPPNVAALSYDIVKLLTVIPLELYSGIIDLVHDKKPKVPNIIITSSVPLSPKISEKTIEDLQQILETPRKVSNETLKDLQILLETAANSPNANIQRSQEVKKIKGSESSENTQEKQNTSEDINRDMNSVELVKKMELLLKQKENQVRPADPPPEAITNPPPEKPKPELRPKFSISRPEQDVLTDFQLFKILMKKVDELEKPKVTQETIARDPIIVHEDKTSEPPDNYMSIAFNKKRELRSVTLPEDMITWEPLVVLEEQITEKTDRVQNALHRTRQLIDDYEKDSTFKWI